MQCKALIQAYPVITIMWPKVTNDLAIAYYIKGMIGEIIQGPRQKPSWLYEAAPIFGFLPLFLIKAIHGPFELLDHVPWVLWWVSIFFGLGWGFICNRMIHLRRRFAPRSFDKGRISNTAYAAAVFGFAVLLSTSLVRLAYEMAAFTAAQTSCGEVELRVIDTYTSGRSSVKKGVVVVADAQGREVKFPSTSGLVFQVMNSLDGSSRKAICITVKMKVGRWSARRIQTHAIEYVDLHECKNLSAMTG